MMKYHSDGLVQETRNSSALAMELSLSCTDPPICNALTSTKMCNRLLVAL